MSVPPRSVFLERKGYRRRRLLDLVRLLPLIGMALWFVPLLWPKHSENAVTTSGAILYIFGVWIVLVGLTAWLSRVLSEADQSRGDDETGGRP